MNISDITEDVKLEIARMQHLAGINQKHHVNDDGSMSPLSASGSAKGEYMKKHDIKPGTEEWFRLWFARPGLTGENPMPRK